MRASHAPAHRPDRSARPRVTRALLVALLALVLAGCGSSTTIQGGNDAFSATTLTVYSVLPMLGPDGARMTEIVNGEALALYEAGGHVGPLHVSLDATNDADSPLISPDALHGDTARTAQAAHVASSDLSTVAYIGGYTSAETALSLPLSNENDVLQISPGSPYVGFTDPSPAALPADPTALYPNHVRTFARLVPSQAVEATATVRFMRSLRVRRLFVLTDASNPPYDSAIAALVAAAAPAAGITVAGARNGIDTRSLTRRVAYGAVVSAVAAAHPDAILLGATANVGADALSRALHARLPVARLFVPSTLATPAFLAGLRAAATATYVTSPILELAQYPPPAQRVLAQYRRLYGLTPSPFVLYGYEAMHDVLLAIAKAYPYAAQRDRLLAAFHRLGVIHGVIGDYSINAAGDTSLASFDGYRVSATGALVLLRRIS